MTDTPHDPSRRRLLGGAAGAALLVAGGCKDEQGGARVYDVAQLQAHEVARVVVPRSTEDVCREIAQSRGVLSIGGGRYSMGGQIAAPRSLHLDMRGLDQLVWLDAGQRRVRVQAGMRWRDLQEHIDPHDLSVAIMQSFSNFTVGGSVSVNCHGRYVGKGPIAGSVRALQLVTADGQSRELDRTREPDLFAAVIGGYGGLGVVTEVELDLDVNTRIRRHVAFVALEDYVEHFRDRVASDADAVLHNADMVPPDFDRTLAITWRRTDEAATSPERLTPSNGVYRREQAMIWSATELHGGDQLRRHLQASMLEEPAPIVWRNRQASLDAAMLEPTTRAMSTYVLQEYFVPVAGFLPFMQRMRTVLRTSGANVLNISIRHSPADTQTLMRWAPTEVFCFVLYFKQRNHRAADREVERWTRALIDAALDAGGRYYLPYRLDATPAQFHAAYPEARRFAELKRRWDPDGRLTNALWSKYLG